MLQLVVDSAEGIAIIRPSGSLRKEDFVETASRIDSYIGQRGKLWGLVVYAQSFAGWQNLGACFPT